MLLPLSIFFLLASTLYVHSSDPDPVQDFCIPPPNPSSSSLPTHHHNQCKDPAEATSGDFVFSGLKSPGNFSTTGFASIPVNPTTFPGLNTLGMSFVRADFQPGAVNPPHFHPRATEIAHVVEGRVYAGFVDSNNRVFARVLEKGEVMVFPRGLVHFQMNVGLKDATVFGSFNGQNPGNQKIPAAVFGSGIDNSLLEKAFGLSSKDIVSMRKRLDPKAAPPIKA
ncbi:Germin-like protein subfamily 3 member 2 [Linum perenne]